MVQTHTQIGLLLPFCLLYVTQRTNRDRQTLAMPCCLDTDLCVCVCVISPAVWQRHHAHDQQKMCICSGGGDVLSLTCQSLMPYRNVFISWGEETHKQWTVCPLNDLNDGCLPKCCVTGSLSHHPLEGALKNKS